MYMNDKGVMVGRTELERRGNYIRAADPEPVERGPPSGPDDTTMPEELHP